METEKVKIQCHVDKETAEKLQLEADDQTRKLGPHATHILTQHAKQLPKPFVSKKEYVN